MRAKRVQMVATSQNGPEPKDRINLYLPESLRERVRRLASERMCTENAALRWAISRFLDQWEELPRSQREAS